MRALALLALLALAACTNGGGVPCHPGTPGFPLCGL